MAVERGYGENDRAGSTGAKSRIGNALNDPPRPDEIPTKDARAHLAAAKPNKDAPPAPSAEERARGYVKSRG